MTAFDPQRGVKLLLAGWQEAGLAARMLLQVHDELIFECPDAEAEETMKLAKRVMVQAPEPAVKLSVPLQVDARAAQDWEAAH